MKQFLKSYRHTLALVAVLVAALGLYEISLSLGASLATAAATGGAFVGCWQLSQFALSKRCGTCFNAVLTPEQVKEFGQILDSLKEYKEIFPGIKDLSGIEGGLKAIKTWPQLFKAQQELNETLKGEMDKLRRAQLASKRSSTPRAGNVSDECAAHLGALAVGFALRQGRLDAIESGIRERLLAKAKEILGVEVKTALSSSDIPLPETYSGDVVELVSQYGAARRYGTVFPLGSGSVNLPRLKTDVTFTLNAISAAITEKSPQTEWVTFTPEKFGGLVRVPSEIDEDSIVPIGQFIARYCARNIARSEDHNFFAGSGAATGVNGTVKGLQFSTIDNSKVTQMASTKTHYSDLTLAHLRAVRAIPDAAALGMSAYYMHPSMEQQLAGLNASGDKPYNPNAQIAGTGANPFTVGPTLDGFPIRWVDVMPAYSTSANASKVFVLFGDLSFQYLGVRGGIRFDQSSQAGFTTDEILIRCLERFTPGLMAVGAVAGIETAAS